MMIHVVIETSKFSLSQADKGKKVMFEMIKFEWFRHKLFPAETHPRIYVIYDISLTLQATSLEQITLICRGTNNLDRFYPTFTWNILLDNILCTVKYKRYTIYDIRYTRCNIQCTIYEIRYTIYYIWCTMYYKL